MLEIQEVETSFDGAASGPDRLISAAAARPAETLYKKDTTLIDNSIGLNIYISLQYQRISYIYLYSLRAVIRKVQTEHNK